MTRLTDADGRVIYEQRDGRHHHIVRQSTLGDIKDLCPERARYHLYGEVPREESDATLTGTGVHAGIEHALKCVIDGHTPVYEEAAEVVENTILGIDVDKWTKFNDKDAMIAQANTHLSNWWTQILPTLEPIEAEHKFSIPMWEDQDRVITAEGTIDYLGNQLSLGDWKTGGREYYQREKQKHNIQSTTYTWARTMETGVFHGNFDFYVMVHGKPTIQKVTVTRTENHWKWLKKQALAYAKLVEANLDVWPMNDTGWWCSASWCPAFNRCKGAA